MLDVFTRIVLAGSLIFTFAWVILAQRRTVKRLSDAYLRLTHFQRVLVVLAVIVCTVYAQKPSTNDVNGVTGTNGVDIVDGGDTNEVDGTSGEAESFPLLMVGTPPFTSGEDTASPFSVTDFVRGYRLESVSTNSDISYTLPADGAIRGTWHLTGVYEDVQKVTLDGFAFPLGSDLCTSLWAYTWGKVRPQLKNASNEIAAVGAPMSAIPEVSRFWTAATSNDTYLITWENFAEGRLPAPVREDADGTVNAQIELFRNGDFITRSNDVESVWRRRMPCDLDEDGWLDIIDPNPTEFDEDGFGPHQTLPEGDNTNYYYWVDLVVDQANARVTFEGDDFSTLPDPDFIARAGETNRVMLLIGKTYVVRCDLPIRCVCKEDDEVCVWSEGYSLGILWPIYLEFVPTEPLLLLAGPLLGAPSNGGGDTGVSVHPERAGGGSFSWENDFCCCSTSRDGSPIFCCDGTCGCGGCYTGDITYLIGGHGLIFGGWYCACSSDPDDPHEGDEPPDGPLAGPCVSATFSADAVIFEDEYENMPGQTIPRRSTETEVEFYAYGGTNGGTYAFSMVNESKLRRLGGAYLPKTGTVRAGESFRIKVRYEALSASGSEGDIKAKAEFTEFQTSRKLPDVETPLTSVKVELTPRYLASGNPSAHRHIVGVDEYVNTTCTPSVSYQWVDDVDVDVDLNETSFWCPWVGGNYRPTVNVLGISFKTTLNVVEPTVYCGVAWWNGNSGTNGIAGNVEMNLALYVEPNYVSFKDLNIEEIPDNVPHSHWGYFDDQSKGGAWSHTSAAGAGRWHPVLDYGFWTFDAVGVHAYPEPWSYGYKVWDILIGWGNTLEVKGSIVPIPTRQEFWIDSDGTVKIRKFQHEISRTIHGRILFDGNWVN